MLMKKCYIVSGFNPIIKDKYDGFLVGVDKGCLYLALKNIEMDVGIGDFDSIADDELEIIKKHCGKLLKLNPIKDDTDMEHALKYVEELGYKEIEVYGCLGGRQDHNLLNIKLLYLSSLNITLFDEKNKMFCLDEGKHVVYKNEYKYLSLFVFEKANVKLEECYYNLDNIDLDINDNYTTSNEILDKFCTLTINKGRVLIIQSKD